jgi:outer membrane protein
VIVARKAALAAMIVSAACLVSATVRAETISGALAQAYANNSSLNSARAGLRATDENVAIAKSGYRPTIAGTASGAFANQRGVDIRTGSFGVSLSQTLFNGFQTQNNVRAAESGVRSGEENLRNTVQNTLFDAASAYMDVIRDRQIAGLRQQSLSFLDEQVRAAKARLDVGEGTRTDVAQAQASQAAAVAQLSAARAQVKTSEATYRQVIGAAPGPLSPASAFTHGLPASLGAAFSIAEAEHPAIHATELAVDAADYTVKSAEGALLPSIAAEASASRNFENPPVSGGSSAYNSTSVGLSLNVPIYSGGRVAATVRQDKETLGQRRIDVDVTRDQVRAAVASAWSQYESAVASANANRQSVSAARLALNGVVEERKVGQATTLDVLTSQNFLLTAQVSLVEAEHDVVVASYALTSAIGRLSPHRLGLRVAEYNPQEHYDAVKDKWFGLRTPDGR